MALSIPAFSSLRRAALLVAMLSAASVQAQFTGEIALAPAGASATTIYTVSQGATTWGNWTFTGTRSAVSGSQPATGTVNISGAPDTLVLKATADGDFGTKPGSYALTFGHNDFAEAGTLAFTVDYLSSGTATFSALLNGTNLVPTSTVGSLRYYSTLIAAGDDFTFSLSAAGKSGTSSGDFFNGITYTKGEAGLSQITVSGISFPAPSAVPEPATYAAIAGAAVLGLAVWRRRAA